MSVSSVGPFITSSVSPAHSVTHSLSYYPVEFDSSSEAMIFSSTGLPLQGITGGFGVDRRVEFIIPQEGRKSGVYNFYVEASCVSGGGTHYFTRIAEHLAMR